ncbi:MAG: hypothetical protein WCI63_01705 [bacterium]
MSVIVLDSIKIWGYGLADKPGGLLFSLKRLKVIQSKNNILRENDVGTSAPKR